MNNFDFSNRGISALRDVDYRRIVSFVRKVSNPKTFAEFELWKQELFSTDFKTTASSPHHFGLERTDFEIERLTKLIGVAEGIEGKTIKGRIQGWKHQLAKLESTKTRFLELLRSESSYGTIETSRR